MSQDNFLPNDYDTSKIDGGSDSRYMKIEPGKNKIRILESPILGYELWIGGKPKRYRMDENIPIKDINSADINKFTGEPRDPQHFWAMPVWNYRDEAVQILNITQASIRKGIEAYAKDEDWGSPLNYDLEISRDGEGKETRYSVIAKPQKELDKEIKTEYENLDIDMKLYFEGGHPIQFDNAGRSSVSDNDQKDVADEIPF